MFPILTTCENGRSRLEAWNSTGTDSGIDSPTVNRYRNDLLEEAWNVAAEDQR